MKQCPQNLPRLLSLSLSHALFSCVAMLIIAAYLVLWFIIPMALLLVYWSCSTLCPKQYTFFTLLIPPTQLNYNLAGESGAGAQAIRQLF